VSPDISDDLRHSVGAPPSAAIDWSRATHLIVTTARIPANLPLYLIWYAVCSAARDPTDGVSPDYGPRGNAFSGRVKGVQIAIAEAAEAVAHLVSPEEAVRIAMARQ
jgi:hypothetical protein